MGYRLMLGLDTVQSVAHVIQVALTPVFLLSGIASLLGVLSTRLARVADRVDALAEQLEADGPIDRHKLQREAGLPPAKVPRARRGRDDGNARWSRNVLCGVASVRRYASRSARCVSLFVAFGLALLFTMGALVAFLIEMLLASRGLRDQANYANEVERDARTRRRGSRQAASRRVWLAIGTREACLHFWPAHSSWRTGLAPEQSIITNANCS